MRISEMAANIGLEVEEFNEIFEIYMETTATDLLALKDALDANDAEEVHRKAHSMKGSSGNLGFNELFELAREIDDHAKNNTLDGVDKLVHNFRDKYEKLVEEFNKSKGIWDGTLDGDSR